MPNNNEGATVPKSKIFHKLNTAWIAQQGHRQHCIVVLYKIVPVTYGIKQNYSSLGRENILCKAHSRWKRENPSEIIVASIQKNSNDMMQRKIIRFSQRNSKFQIQGESDYLSSPWPNSCFSSAACESSPRGQLCFSSPAACGSWHADHDPHVKFQISSYLHDFLYNLEIIQSLIWNSDAIKKIMYI